jgi:hypothetical protein
MSTIPGLRAKVQAEVRRQWRRYAVSVWVQTGATVAILGWMSVAHWDGLRSRVGAFLVAALFVGYAAVAVRGNAHDPHTWFRSAVRFGCASWFVGLGAMASDRPAPPETALVLTSLVVLCVVAWIPAGRAKSNGEAELGYADLMADEDFGRRFAARDNGVVFEVDNVKVMMTCVVRSRQYVDKKSGTSYLRGIGDKVMIAGCSLGDIKRLRAVYLRTARTSAVPGRPGYVLELTPG